jgi:hypothetical protein
MAVILSILAVYMTGAGGINPPGIDGAVTCSSECATPAQIPKRIEPPIALVGELTLEGWPAINRQ